MNPDDIQRIQRQGRTLNTTGAAMPRGPLPSLNDIAGGSSVMGQVTQPGVRPFKYQQAINFVLTLTANVPMALTPSRMEVDTIVLDVFSTAANSVFFGYGNQISPTTGIEIRPGLPVAISADFEREHWEIQQPAEFIAAVIAKVTGENGLGTYRAPRTVFDSSAYYVIATAATNISVMLFTVAAES